MTTIHAPHTTTTQGPALLPIAAVTLVASFAFTSLGTVASGSGHHGWGEFLTICGISVVAVALVLGLAVSRLQDGPRAGAVGLGLAIFGLATVLVFWAGVTPALAVGGILLGMGARRTGQSPGPGTAAIAVGALALAGYVAVYVGDWVANL